MSDRQKPFPFDIFEPQWQDRWENEKTFRTPQIGESDFDSSKPKYFVLDMFPYPSGAGLHVGHPEGYTATDILGRYKRMTGHNVLHPMGWDAFGLPAEQHAIKTGEHPSISTKINTDNFRRQLKSLGFGYDWDREINTTDPDYVKWTQWIFIQLYNSYFCPETKKARPISELADKGFTKAQMDEERLAFVSEAPVNWSPDLGTVLANEEVEEWKAKGHIVERRPLKQWMLRITKFAQRLIDDLEPLDWPDSIKALQTNWIGKSVGAEVDFDIEGHTVTVFTTRPDTLFGATYMVLAPEHSLVSTITSNEQKDAIADYIAQCSTKSDLERGDLNKDKSGIFTGAYATNPVNGEKIPVWIADYVMMGYGTGAIMAVPGHDERDFEFAKANKLPIKQVIALSKDEIPHVISCNSNRDMLSVYSYALVGKSWESIPDPRVTGTLSKDSSPPYDVIDFPITGNGYAADSGFLDGMKTKDAKKAMIKWLLDNKKGTFKTNFKLRDWLFSRQRYWGEPFPILWENGEHSTVPESELPVLQPNMEDFKPTGSPEGPLAKATDWIAYSEGVKRETNTMPQWAGSCWYYLRYCDPNNNGRFISREAEEYWMGGNNNPGGVDLYVGGTEHAVLHLLYARFWHKVLFDLGHLSTNEPFQKLVNQGLILGEDGQKMSKSIGNVVNPDEVVQLYGADALRLYEMFMGPLTQVKPWQMKGVEGVSRFLAKVWRVAMVENQAGEWTWSGKVNADTAVDKALRKVTHETIKKVTEDIEAMSFNTAISQMMICTNAFTKAESVSTELFEQFLTILNPFAPHLTEELNKLKGNNQLISEQSWPVYNEEFLIESEIQLVVQVNGKVRAKLMVSKDASKEEVEELAKSNEQVANFLEGNTIRKVIVVPGRLVNIVAN